MTLLEILHWLVETNKFVAPVERQLIHDAVDALEQPRHAPASGANEPPAVPAPAPVAGAAASGYTEPGSTSGEE